MFSSLAPYFQIFKSVSDLELLEAVRRPTGTWVLPLRSHGCDAMLAVGLTDRAQNRRTRFEFFPNSKSWMGLGHVPRICATQGEIHEGRGGREQRCRESPNTRDRSTRASLARGR
jgi:hypothetical protein